MRLISPALYYLKFLICHPDGHTNDAIKERCSDERVDFISDAYLDKLRGQLKTPTPFYPSDRRHKKSFKFLIEEGIHTIFTADVSMRMALQVLERPRAKEFIETNLLLRVPFSPIAAFVEQRYKVPCTYTALQLYQHYFWNIDLLDSTEMRVLIAMRVEQTADNVPEFKDKKKLLQSAYYKDPRKIAADLPSSPMAVMLAQTYLGIRPGKADLTLRMMETRDLALIRAGEAAMQNSVNDSVKFLNFTNGSRILEEMLQLVAKPEDHMQEQLRALALRTDTRTIPSIHQLSAGAHTVDISPLEDRHEPGKAFESERSDRGSDGRTDG